MTHLFDITFFYHDPPECDEPDPVGTEPGETCNRCEEPDEDAPRGYRPKPCQGEMIDEDGVTMCAVCEAME